MTECMVMMILDGDAGNDVIRAVMSALQTNEYFETIIESEKHNHGVRVKVR